MKHPRLRLFVIVAVFLAAAAFATLILARSHDTMAASAKKLPFYASSKYEYTGTGFLYIEGMTLHYYDLTESKNSYSVNISGGDVHLAGHDLLHVLYTESSLQIINSQFPIEFNGSIISAKCGNGVIAVHKRDGSQDSVRLFDAAGSQIDEITFTDSALMDYGFYYSGKTCSLYMIATNTNSSSPVTELLTYSVTSSSSTHTGVIVVQNELITDAVFSGSSIFLTGTDNIIRYSADNNTESYRLRCYGMKLLDRSALSSQAVFVMTPNSADENALSYVRLYRASQSSVPEETMNTLQLPRSTVSAFASGDRVYVITQSAIETYRADGRFSDREDLAFPASSACKLDDDRLLIASGEDMYLLTFK